MTTQQALALALQHHQAGRLAEAEALYRQILAVQPDNADALHLLGVIAHQAGHHTQAIEWIRQATVFAPNSPEAYSNLGEACRAAGRLEEAAASYRRALALQPHYPEACNNLGVTLTAQGQLDEAIAACRRALQLKPDYPEAHNNLGNALAMQGQFDEAVAAYHRALQLKPNYPEAHYNLGNALERRGRIAEAMAAYRRALELKPDYLGANVNLGNVLKDQGQWDEAEACYRRGIACPGESTDAHFNLGFLLLLRGRYEEGWHEYEWRWRSTALASDVRNFSAPLWDGQPAAGKTLLIHAEQGLGDTLQFLRYLPLVRERAHATRVILECQPALVPLLDQLREADFDIIPRGGSDAALPPFDLHLPLLSLPLVLRRYEPLPMGAPHLQADTMLRTRWRERIPSDVALRVGVAWAGNPVHHDDRRRSIAPEKLAPILNLPGTRFVSLQVEPRGPLPSVLAAADVRDFSSDIVNFDDSAALMAELDLMITVDTAAAHLAGALGRTVWLLLPFVPDWRWGLERADTPWYPTMRLFRQSRAGDWEEVVERVAAALRDRCAQASWK